jgi:glutathionyl-hydroquinone reductase
VRAGLTTSQTTSDQQLTELLNCLESVVESLNYKSFTLYDTLNTAMEEVFAVLKTTPINEAGTNADWC